MHSEHLGTDVYLALHVASGWNMHEPRVLLEDDMIGQVQNVTISTGLGASTVTVACMLDIYRG